MNPTRTAISLATSLACLAASAVADYPIVSPRYLAALLEAAADRIDRTAGRAWPDPDTARLPKTAFAVPSCTRRASP